MLYRNRSIIFTLILTLLVLGGCTQAAPEAIKETVIVEQEVEVTPVPAQPEHTEPVTLVYWSDPRFTNVKGMEDITQVAGDYEMLLAEEFMKLHPNVTIEVEALKWEDLSTKVTAAIAAGSPPDILKDYLGRTSGYAWQGLLEPLEGAIPQEEYDDYLPDLIDQYTINGHLHGLPLFYWVTSMAVNRAIWDEAGATDLLPLDDGEWTFDEFEAAIRAVQKPDELWPIGLKVSSEQGDYQYLAFPWGMGATLYPPGDYTQTALNSPEGISGIEKIVQWVNEGLIAPGATTLTGADLDNMFFSGQTAIQGYSLVFKSVLSKAIAEGRVTADIDLIYTMYPHAPGVTTGGMAAGPTGVVVFKQDDPEKLYWATEFVRYLASTELQREYSINSYQFPARISVGTPLAGDIDYEKLLKWVQEYGLSDMGLASPHYGEVRVELFPRLQAAMLGDMTAVEALAEYEEVVNAILSE